jgi:broad specificity phosphatase PhoE
MTNLVLVRHGQTDWNLEGRYQGQKDVPLNAAGLEQAHQLAQKLAGQHFMALFSSDLQRASKTAEILGQVLGLPVRIDRRLREINQGCMEGQLVDFVFLKRNQDVDTPVPGGESIRQVADRVAAAIDDIAQTYAPGPLLVVTHGLALATLLCRVHGFPLESAYQHIPANMGTQPIDWQFDPVNSV